MALRVHSIFTKGLQRPHSVIYGLVGTPLSTEGRGSEVRFPEHAHPLVAQGGIVAIRGSDRDPRVKTIHVRHNTAKKL